MLQKNVKIKITNKEFDNYQDFVKYFLSKHCRKKANDTTKLTNKKMGEILGLDYSTVSGMKSTGRCTANVLWQMIKIESKNGKR